MTAWNGFDESDIEIHLDELAQEDAARRAEQEAEAPYLDELARMAAVAVASLRIPPRFVGLEGPELPPAPRRAHLAAIPPIRRGTARKLGLRLPSAYRQRWMLGLSCCEAGTAAAPRPCPWHPLVLPNPALDEGAYVDVRSANGQRHYRVATRRKQTPD